MFSVDFETEQLKKSFNDFRTADTIATRNTLNIAAASTRKKSISFIRNEYTLRNTFTTRQIQFDRVQTNNRSKMVSRTGATEKASYMETQHNGGIRKPSKKRRFQSKGLSLNTIPKKARSSFNTPIGRQNYLRKIVPKFTKGSYKSARSDKSQFVARMFVAKRNNLFVHRRGNIYAVNSIKTKRNGNIKANLRQLYTGSNTPIRIKRQDWLSRYAEQNGAKIGEIYKGQLQKVFTSGKVL